MRKKRSPHKILKDKLWDLVSQYVRRVGANEAGYVACVTCEQEAKEKGTIAVKRHWKELQAGHFLAGRSNGILYDLRGIKPQCPGCNLARPYGKGGYIEMYYPWMLKHYGQQVIDELKYLKRQTFKYDTQFYEDKINEYKEKLAELEKKV